MKPSREPVDLARLLREATAVREQARQLRAVAAMERGALSELYGGAVARTRRGAAVPARSRDADGAGPDAAAREG